MENMVLSTITNGELTEMQSERVKAITDKFGKSFENVASVCIRYNDVLEKSEVAFCEYAHTALELLKKSKVHAKNKVFAEMTGIRTDKITKCDKVYTEVIANISNNLVERCGYNSRNELLTDYSFSQLYVMKRVKNKFAFELMFLEHINNYTVSEITFLTDMEDMRLMNGDETAIEEFFERRKIYIGQHLKIDEFEKYEFDENTNCYVAKNNDNNGNSGDNNGNSGDNNGNSGDNNGNSGDNNGNTGDNNGNSGDNNGNSGDNNGNSGDNNDNSGDNNDNSGDNNGNSGDNNGNSGDNNGNSGDNNGNSGDNNGNSNEKTLDINTILEYIRQYDNIEDIKTIKAVCSSRIKELSK